MPSFFSRLALPQLREVPGVALTCRESEHVTLFPETLTVVHADTVRGAGCKKLNNRMRSARVCRALVDPSGD